MKCFVKSRLWQFLLGLFVSGTMISLSGSTIAQVVPDDTLGTERSQLTQETIRGLESDRISGGARRGANLFHSFRQFDIGENRGAYFENPIGVERILMRVTGGDRSDILGRLGVLGNADLFLLNPSGIVFGRNASLDLRGSFVASTANSLLFDNGFAFSTTNPQVPSLLTVSVPIGLQYGTNSVGLIGFAQSNLTIAPGQNLVFAGGNILFDGASIKGDKTVGGRIELGSVDGSGTVGLSINENQVRLVFPDNLARSNIALVNGSALDVRSANAGDIAIYANNFGMTGGSILRTGILPGQSSTNNQTGDILINASGTLSLLEDSQIKNQLGEANAPSAIGNAGNISIVTGSLLMKARNNTNTGTFIDSFSFGQSRAGNITIQARDQIILDGNTQNNRTSVVIGSAVPSGAGQTGRIEIAADSLFILNGAAVSSGTGGQGQAGNINIQARDLSVTNAGRITSFSLGRGNAGNINIESNRIQIDGSTQAGEAGSGILSASQAGARGGNIDIATNSLSLTNGAALISGNGGGGNAGNITIRARDSIDLRGTNRNSQTATRIESSVRDGNGRGGRIDIATNSLTIANGAQVVTNTIRGGDAGDISIQARDSIELNGGETNQNSSLITSYVDSKTGRGGNIDIDTNSLSIRNVGAIASATNGQGRAGDINIRVSDRILLDGGRRGASFGIVDNSRSIAAIVSGVSEGATGQGGNVNVASNSLTITGNAIIGSTAGGRSNAGDVNIRARDLSVSDAGGILTRAFDQGNAGDITIQSERIRLGGIDQRGNLSVVIASQAKSGGQGGNIDITTDVLSMGSVLLTSVTDGGGDAGNISIRANNSIELRGSPQSRRAASIISSFVQSGAGQGGEVNITTDSLFMRNLGIISSNTTGQGRAGNIIIRANDLTARNASFISTSTSGQGDAGTINIRAADRIVLQGGNSNQTVSSGITSDVQGSGQGGNIALTTDSLSVSNGAILTASTLGQGRAGNITIDATDRILLSGTSPRGSSSGLYTFSTTNATRTGGRIRLNTDLLRLSDGALINAQTSGTQNGGNISISADSLAVINGGQVLTTTTNRGQAGNIRLNISENLTLSGSDRTYARRLERFGRNTLAPLAFEQRTSIPRIGLPRGVLNQGAASGVFANASSNSTGQGGNIAVNTGAFLIQDGARISVGSQGRGTGGRIQVQADNLFMRNRAQISTETRAANGGDITLSGIDTLLLRDRSTISSTAGTARLGGNGGNITINANAIVAPPNEDSDIRANAFTGRGGVVAITTQGLYGIEPSPAGVLTSTGQSEITATSAQGVQGEVIVNTPNVDPKRGLTELPENLVDATQQIDRSLCKVTRSSEFIITGRGGLPPTPNEPTNSEELWEDWRLSSIEEQPESSPNTPESAMSPPMEAIEEAQGWMIDPEGRVVLVGHQFLSRNRQQCL